MAAALLFTGCGGGNESESLSTREFGARANAICAETKRSTARFIKDFPSPRSTPRQAQQFFKEIAPFVQQAAERLAALPAPAGNEEQVKALQDAYERQARGIAAAGESPAKAKEALNRQAPFTQAGNLGNCVIDVAAERGRDPQGQGREEKR